MAKSALTGRVETERALRDIGKAIETSIVPAAVNDGLKMIVQEIVHAVREECPPGKPDHIETAKAFVRGGLIIAQVTVSPFDADKHVGSEIIDPGVYVKGVAMRVGDRVIRRVTERIAREIEREAKG